MRLFGKVDGAINRFDRAEWMMPPFDREQIMPTSNEVHLLKALACNKMTLNVSSGVLTIYDDDDATILATVTPTETGGVVTLDLSVQNVVDATDIIAEFHKVKAFLLNKRLYTIDTHDLEVKDDDGTTGLFTLSKTEAAGVVTREAT